MVALLLVLLIVGMTVSSRRAWLLFGARRRGISSIWRGSPPLQILLRRKGYALAQQVKESIGLDRLIEVVDLLLGQQPVIVDSNCYSQLQNLRGRIYFAENEWRMGMISFETYELSRNKQRLCLIHICEEIFSKQT